MLRRCRLVVVMVSLLLLSNAGSNAQDPPPPKPTDSRALPTIKDALVIPTVGRYGRDAIYVDHLEAQMAKPDWQPREGDEIAVPGSGAKWIRPRFDADGAMKHDALRGGYMYVAFEAAADQVLLLETRGTGIVYVNGVPRTGDPYGSGAARLPVELKAGTNHLLAQCYRGSFAASFALPPSKAFFEARDPTLPDLLIEEVEPVWGAVVVVNATTEPLEGLRLTAACAGEKPTQQVVPYLPPLSARKVPFRIVWQMPEPGEATVVTCAMRLAAGDAADTTLSQLEIKLPLRTAAGLHKRTFLSDIDGSVQYYAVLPAKRPEGQPPPEEPPALFLTLHGAGVEATGHAAAYSPKTWGHVVAATNRRPFGFDWEDWGRLDALEVLADASKRLKTDPRRTYLTGHSMGGHGVWHLAGTYPDRFAAIGPSAGWISFFSYGVSRPENPDAVQRMLARATGGSETVSLVRNYSHQGVYVLHGERDDNVPVDQSRTMRKHLGEFHRDFAYCEQAGAGHWWDGAVGGGADCVDWEPMFEFFRRKVAPDEKDVHQVAFTTVNPSISGSSHWATIETQLKQGDPSTVDLRFDPAEPSFAGTTQNVKRLTLDLERWPPDKEGSVTLDGGEAISVTRPTGDGRQPLWLVRDGQQWKRLSKELPTDLKGAHRHGPFKEAFRNRVVFVYGTRGTPEENAWALAKARFDAETFWYRGNGSVDVIPDTRLAALEGRGGTVADDAASGGRQPPDKLEVSKGNPDAKPAANGAGPVLRNVILYGNADTNGAWAELLEASPVQVRRGKVLLDERELTGDDLVCLFCRPRPQSDHALVGVVAVTGAKGHQAAQRANYFVSGTGYPDLLIYGADMLTRGSRGVRVAGYFGNDWSVLRGDWVFGEQGKR